MMCMLFKVTDVESDQAKERQKKEEERRWARIVRLQSISSPEKRFPGECKVLARDFVARSLG